MIAIISEEINILITWGIALRNYVEVNIESEYIGSFNMWSY